MIEFFNSWPRALDKDEIDFIFKSNIGKISKIETNTHSMRIFGITLWEDKEIILSMSRN